jgi:DNA polymerase-3 subunit epsilon
MMATGDARSCIVLDFETTGLSPAQGDRAIEIGAVRLRDGVVVDRFQSLMHPGMRISSFIEGYTGISNSMLADAESCEVVMQRFVDFAGDSNFVAHNASFDRRFLEAEYSRIGCAHSNNFACSMLAARRLCPDVPNHRLGTLVECLALPNDGTFHRALADAEMTAALWLQLLDALGERGPRNVRFADMVRLCQTSKAEMGRFVERLSHVC